MGHLAGRQKKMAMFMLPLKTQTEGMPPARALGTLSSPPQQSQHTVVLNASLSASAYTQPHCSMVWTTLLFETYSQPPSRCLARSRNSHGLAAGSHSGASPSCVGKACGMFDIKWIFLSGLVMFGVFSSITFFVLKGWGADSHTCL
jgi:hypothetical protein